MGIELHCNPSRKQVEGDGILSFNAGTASRKLKRPNCLSRRVRADFSSYNRIRTAAC